MPIAAISAALFSALIHSSWNALLKGGKDRLADSTVISFAWLAIGVVLALWKGLLPPEAWAACVASALVHCFAWLGLTKGYDSGDLSHVYTLARGLAPTVAALAAFVFVGESVSWLAMGGIACVCLGVLAVGASPHAPLRATGWALFTATMIGLYSLLDALGARAAGDSVQYLAWNLITSALPIIVVAFARREPGALLRAARSDWLRGLSAGIVSATGYGVVLYAQTLAPVAQVTALRETSVVFAALIAFFFLKEKLGPRRWGGAVLVALGAGLIAFG